MRTKHGLILEKLLSNMKERYILCWNGEGDEEAYDCVCCMTWSDDDLYNRCKCVCHTRIESMALAPGMKLFLLAAESMGQLPKFFTSYAEKLTHSKPILAAHEEQRQLHIKAYDFGPCTCEFCEFARNDLKVRKFAIEGEDNSHISEENDADDNRQASNL